MHSKSTGAILGVAFTLIAKPSHALSSSDYAAMGSETWSAFQFSVLAEKSNDIDEQKRLFEYGYVHGLEFIKAIQDGKVSRDDLSRSTPLMVLLLLQGPTPDFILGRIFEGALTSALEDVYRTNGNSNSDEVQELIAKNKFTGKNCQLIGR